MPATGRHGAAQATHSTSRTTANVSYHLWQHCCWQDTIAGDFFSSEHLLNLFQELYSNTVTRVISFVVCSHKRLLLLWTWIQLPWWFSLISPLIRVVLCLLSAVVSGGFSPSSTATSGFSSQGSNTLPCPIPPSSPRNSTGRRRNRKKDHKSSRMISRMPTLVSFYLFLYNHLNGWVKPH